LRLPHLTGSWPLQDAKARGDRSGAALVAAMQTSPSRDIEIELARERLPVRHGDL
jgi:hypothetical protein